MLRHPHQLCVFDLLPFTFSVWLFKGRNEYNQLRPDPKGFKVHQGFCPAIQASLLCLN